jgi:hypothetical protein
MNTKKEGGKEERRDGREREPCKCEVLSKCPLPVIAKFRQSPLSSFLAGFPTRQTSEHIRFWAVFLKANSLI